jgi:hypothetical protein
MLEVFEHVYDLPGACEACLTILAPVDVCAKGCDAKADLAVEQQVDLIREQVTMLHRFSSDYDSWVAGVSTQNRELATQHSKLLSVYVRVYSLR